MFSIYWYYVAVDAIEKDGGPTLIDRVAPASWLIERAMKARWPRCVAAAKPISTRLGKRSRSDKRSDALRATWPYGP